jgi:hypothetical protein
MKKGRELAHLLSFKKVCPFFPNGEINCSEKPDFLVNGDNYLLGIEHTEIFQPGTSDGKSLQAQDNLGQRITRKASNLYPKHHLQTLLVQIFFNYRATINKQDIDRLTKAVVNLVEKTHVEPKGTVTLKKTKDNSDDFPNEILRIHISDSPNGKESQWRCSSAGFIPKLTPEHLQQKIDQKEQKLDNYNSDCSEIWLLIVADNSRIPTSIELSELATEYQYSSRFERVFLFWNSTKRYFELKVRTL